MALKAKLSADDHKKLSGALQGEYVAQADGSFLLVVEAVDGIKLENVDALASTMRTERDGHKEARRLLEAFKQGDGYIDPVKAREALQKVDEIKSWKPDDKVREQLAAMKAEHDARLTTEIKTRDDRNAFLQREIDKSYVEKAALSALAAHGITETAELLMPHVTRYLRAVEENGTFVTRVVDENGNPRTSGKTGTMHMDPVEFVGSLKNDKKSKPAFPAETKPGSGASSGRQNGASGGQQLSSRDKIAQGLGT